MLKLPKFTSDSGWLARYEFLVISEGYHVDLLICSFLVVGHCGLKMKKWLTNSQFELREARALRQTSSRRLQALLGEQAQRKTQQTSESHHRSNLTSVSKVCEAGQISLSLAPNGVNELPVVRFKFPFTLIGKSTFPFLKGQS